MKITHGLLLSQTMESFAFLQKKSDLLTQLDAEPTCNFDAKAFDGAAVGTCTSNKASHYF